MVDLCSPSPREVCFASSSWDRLLRVELVRPTYRNMWLAGIVWSTTSPSNALPSLPHQHTPSAKTDNRPMQHACPHIHTNYIRTTSSPHLAYTSHPGCCHAATRSRRTSSEIRLSSAHGKEILLTDLCRGKRGAAGEKKPSGMLPNPWAH